ncbi:hypothetical protein FJW08_21200 [Mesorhizobium sp. B3-2-1]|uniref:hypothetical protein n=1 Tax=Mesorhizobium sp. B3-2-1 TaxID=2589891 RepID=UPI00112D18B9|nr:hypothetical protein [Mesorhizobium sp. B3-2-1]TPI28297.1 hypothetical protein FJW08_21200 [Mesorhizobium sp. B3-2-1]
MSADLPGLVAEALGTAILVATVVGSLELFAGETGSFFLRCFEYGGGHFHIDAPSPPWAINSCFSSP